MQKLKEIQIPIKQHIEIFEKKFKASMKSKVPMLDIITRYIIKRKGKQMRPMFVFLSAGVLGGITESGYRAAGDYLLSRGLLLALEHDEYQLLKIVSNATREMSEGELLQIEKARRLDIDEEIYFEIIRKKTASLIASCCAAGAASAGADKEMVDRMHRFGEYVGIAFQIKDDLFDYQENKLMGKPNGIDIKEQKMTLPLIHMLNNSGFMEKRKIINIVKNHNNNPEKVAQVIAKVNRSGGIEYAYNKMIEYQQKAFGILHQFPESTMRSSLENLVIFTTERNK
ncbi:MAG: polyprenyl synthetase [Bacteroidetes bacterium 4484_276]|nr:MAG: polyprenyl synthetase [Bacteroidetes bacterium 4484_276]